MHPFASFRAGGGYFSIYDGARLIYDKSLKSLFFSDILKASSNDEKTGGKIILLDVLQAIKNDFEIDFRKKTVGFYLTAVAAILSIATAVIYIAGYKDDTVLGTYYSVGVPAFLIVGAVLFVVLSLFRTTMPFAAGTMGTCLLVALCFLIRNSYMYATVIFYEGSTPGTMFVFIGTIAFTVAALALSFAGVLMKQRKEEKDA